MLEELPLEKLLTFTRDGEWGEGQPGPDLVEMAVIRGTDFAAVRRGDLSSVPRRYIPRKAAERKMLFPGDVLIETAGGTKDQPTGRTLYLDESIIRSFGVPTTCASFARFLRADPRLVNPRYLFWYLQSIYTSGEMLPYHVQHTGVARFQYTDFASQWRVPLPSRSRQQAISEALSSLDDKTELNRRMNETLEAMAQAIFSDWFVDFGPTRRKLEGATDPVTIMGGLVKDPATAEILAGSFPDQLDEVERPLGWEEHKLGDAFDLVMGQSPPGSTYNEKGDGLPFFQGRRDFSARFPVARVYCTAPTRTAQKDWTLVSVRAPVGDVNRAESECCIGRGVGALSHKQGLLSFTYYAVLNLQPALAAFEGDGTVFGSVNQKQIKALKMFGGTSPLARTYDDLVKPIDAMIRLRTAENRTLAATRDLLLPKLMSGEIRLREAEEMLEAAQ